MTVSSSTNRVSYSGNGSLTTFAYTFKVFDETDLTVILRAADGTETKQTITTHYTVTNVGNASGGNVEFVAAPSATETVVIVREQPLTQGLDLVPNDPFPAQSLEESLDKLTFVDQRLNEKIDRALTFSVGDVVTDTTLPVKELRVGKVLAFNETTGDPEPGPSIADTESIANISADIATLVDIQDGTVATNAITNVNTIRTDVTTVSGISANVTTVATNNANVTTVAANDANITTVATNIASINTVATNIADVITVANDLNEAISEIETVANDLNEAVSEIDTVASSITNVDLVGNSVTDVNTVAGSISNVNTTAANIADVNTVASVSTNVSTVAGISSDVTTVSGIDANVTTVAGISSNVTTVAGISGNVTTVAGQTTNLQNVTDNLTAIQNAATNATNAATSATNAATSATAAAASQAAAATSAASAASAYDSFDDRYLGVKTSDPTVDNDGDPLSSGLLYFSSSENIMKVYDGASWIAATSAGNVSLTTYQYTATSGQTTFSGSDDNAATLSYTVNNILVTLNGSLLFNGTDYTATNGTSIVLTSGATTSDVLQVTAFKSFTTADMVPASTGGTFSGNVAVTGDLTVDTNTLYVDSSNNRVGIGTSSPSAALDVSTSGSTKAAILDGNGVDITHPTLASHLFLGTQTGSDVKIESVGAYPMLFRTNSTEAMRITSSGSVGIGTTSPSTPLHVSKGGNGIVTFERSNKTSNSGYLGFNVETNSQATIAFDYSGGLSIGRSSDPSTQAGYSNDFFINSSGNVGIGTASPDGRLDVTGSGNTEIYINTGNNSGDNSRIFFGDTADIDVGWLNYDHGTNSMSFGVNATERMRIDSSGHLLVGTTVKETQGVTIYGTGANGIYAKCTGTTNYWITRDGQGAGSGYIATIYSDTTAVGSITVTASSTAYNTSSDYRLKENVTDVTDGITRVKQLAPKRFNFIADPDTTVDGFIAHEAQTVVPEAVTGTQDAMRDEEYEVTPAVLDDDGNVVTEAVMGTRSVPDYQGIDQSKLVPLLTAALQEAIAKIETLETEMTSVKARLDALEAN
jgi:hypothetical protein